MARGNLAAQVDGVWYDDQYLEVTNGLSSKQKACNASNASLTYTHDASGESLSLWGKNVFSKAYRVAVLGGGVIGITNAYYLAKAGHEVVLVDRREGPALETSFANADPHRRPVDRPLRLTFPFFEEPAFGDFL